MSSELCYKVVVIIILVMTECVPGSDNNSFDGLRKERLFLKLSSQATRNSVTKDIQPVISALEETRSSIRLYLLYDDSYNDTVRDLIQVPRKYFNGMMIYMYDGSTAGLTQLLNSANGITLLIVLCKPQRLLQVFEKLRDQRIDRYKVIWISILEDERKVLEKVKTDLERVIPEGSHVILLCKYPSDSTRLYSSRVDRRGGVRFLDHGKLNGRGAYHGDRLLNLFTRVPELDYLDMKGRTLLVGALDFWPFFKLGKKLGDGTYEAGSGFEASIVKALEPTLNFTFRVKTPADLNFGGVLPNGTATGLIGLVERREANFALSSIGISAVREIAVDFTFSYFRYMFVIVSKAPGRKSRTFAVFSPFSVEVWLCIVSSLVLTGSALAIIANVSKSFTYVKMREWFIDTFTFNMYRSMLQQGNLFEPDILPFRLIFFCWYFFALIVLVLYSGNLTALLAIPAFEKSIDSLTDLPRAVKEGYVLTLGKGSTLDFVLREADSGIYKDTWLLVNKQEPARTFFRSGGAGDWLPKLLNEKMVIMTTREGIEIRAKEFGRRNFHIGRDPFLPLGMGIACAIGAPLKNVLDKYLMRMFEGGLVNKWKDDESNKFPDKVSQQQEPALSAINLNHLQAAFYIILFGALVSLLVLVAEMVFHYLFP